MRGRDTSAKACLDSSQTTEMLYLRCIIFRVAWRGIHVIRQRKIRTPCMPNRVLFTPPSPLPPPKKKYIDGTCSNQKLLRLADYSNSPFFTACHLSHATGPKPPASLPESEIASERCFCQDSTLRQPHCQDSSCGSVSVPFVGRTPARWGAWTAIGRKRRLSVLS